MAISADLGKPLEEFVESLVKSGRYGSKSEVLREGIRLVQERETRLLKLKADIQEGIDAADRGELYELDEVFDELLGEVGRRMKVRISRPARADIRGVFEHLERIASRRKAQEIASEIRERCEGLSRMPERYQRLRGFEHAGIRRRVYRDYLIIYRITGSAVEVIRVMHGAEDIETLLAELK